MLAPLPTLYRHLVVAIGLVIGMASGAWIALATSVSLVTGTGAVLGALAGLTAAFVLVHDFSHHPRPARITPRR